MKPYRFLKVAYYLLASILGTWSHPHNEPLGFTLLDRHSFPQEASQYQPSYSHPYGGYPGWINPQGTSPAMGHHDVLRIGQNEPHSTRQYPVEKPRKREHSRSHRQKGDRGMHFEKRQKKVITSEYSLSKFDSLPKAPKPHQSILDQKEESSVEKMVNGFRVNRDLLKKNTMNGGKVLEDAPTEEYEINPDDYSGGWLLDDIFKDLKWAGRSDLFVLDQCSKSEQLIIYKYFLFILKRQIKEISNEIIKSEECS